jgi:predicted aspartyl protease
MALACGELSAQDAAPLPPAAPKEIPLPKGTVALPLKLFANRLFVKVKVGDAEYDGLIDTGSECTLLNRAKVNVKEAHMVGSDQLEGAFVGGMRPDIAQMPSLALGEFAVANARVGIVNQPKEEQPLGRIEVLLGMDILGKRRITLDFVNDRLLIWPDGAPLPKPAEGQERITFSAQRAGSDAGIRPRVQVRFGGKISQLMLIDTGADDLIVSALRKPDELGAKLEAQVLANVNVNDGQTRQLEMHQASFDSIDIGTLKLSNVTGRFVDGSAIVNPVAKETLNAAYNLIGTQFLRTQCKQITFDLANRNIYFDRAKK